MYLGILAAITAGAMWGIAFVAPRTIEPFTQFDLTIARLAIFGVTSILLFALPAFRPTGLSLRQCMMSALLGFIGYVGIFLSVAYAVTFAGTSIPPLVVGLLPVVLAVIGNLRERTTPWLLLFIPLAIIGAGILIINFWAIEEARKLEIQHDLIIGTAFSVLALLLWILYGVLNASAMNVNDPPRALPWTSLHGVGALLGLIPVSIVILITGETSFGTQSLESPEGIRFLMWALISGIGGSWVAALTWAVASRRLPLSLAAQLLISEVVFGLIYGFIYEGRGPSFEEWTGATLMISGVLLAIHFAHKKRLATDTPL